MAKAECAEGSWGLCLEEVLVETSREQQEAWAGTSSSCGCRTVTLSKTLQKNDISSLPFPTANHSWTVRLLLVSSSPGELEEFHFQHHLKRSWDSKWNFKVKSRISEFCKECFEVHHLGFDIFLCRISEIVPTGVLWNHASWRKTHKDYFHSSHWLQSFDGWLPGCQSPTTDRTAAHLGSVCNPHPLFGLGVKATLLSLCKFSLSSWLWPSPPSAVLLALPSPSPNLLEWCSRGLMLTER